MKKLLFIVSMLAAYSVSAHYRMQPIKDNNNCYHYDAQDYYEHINFNKAVSFVAGKVASPLQLVNAIVAKFYPKPTTEERLDAVALLQPTQTVPQAESIQPVITWIGHATFLVQINGFNILTDPLFGSVNLDPIISTPFGNKRIQLAKLSKRAMEPGIKLKDLPKIDAIVISHDHSDHTDAYSLMEISKRDNPMIYVPEGNRVLFESFGFTHVVENTWWNQNQLTKNGVSLTITCLPARHWSIRFSLGSYRKSLWSGWMISGNEQHIFFAGDTGYGPHFKQIAQEFPSISVALMPIASTGKNKKERNPHALYHTDASEAIDAFIDLKAKYFVPMHYGTIFLKKENLTYPVERLHSDWAERTEELQDKELIFARCGEQYRLI